VTPKVDDFDAALAGDCAQVRRCGSRIVESARDMPAQVHAGDLSVAQPLING
jgi:hypothetical protein